jgi:hypothetical protein
MAKQPVIDYSKRTNNSAGQGIVLIWKYKRETDATKYEMFNRLSVLFTKYKDGQLGVQKGTLNNYFSKMKGEDNLPIMFENEIIRIVRTTLYTSTMFNKEVEK